MFREILQKLVESVDGAHAAIVMGFDGIAVDSSIESGGNIEQIYTIGMEFSVVLTQMRKAADILQIGSLVETAIRTEKTTLVVRTLNPDYFVALWLTPQGNLGKARYALRVTVPRLQSEL